MRVLMFGWEFPPFITGGLGTACYGLSHELSKLVDRIVFVVPGALSETQVGKLTLKGSQALQASRKHINTVCSYLENFEKVIIDSPLRPYLTATAYEAWLKGSHESTLSFSQGHGPEFFSIVEGHTVHGHYGKNLFEEVTRFALLASSLVEAQGFDLIHAHDWMTFPAAVAAKKASGLPLVVHVHALEFDRSGENIDKRLYEIELHGMQEADLVVTVSNRTREMIIHRYGISPTKVRVLHNGVLALHPGTPVRRPKILEEKIVVFLGRITMQKGPEYFIDAAELVCRHMQNVRFVMAGEGDMLPRMILRMAEKRLNLKFHFTGFISENLRSQLLSIADLFVMTSVSEPFGLTPIEAAQHDVPVIIPHQSGVAEVMNHALKIDFWDTERIASAIIQVLSSPSLAHQMVEASRSEVQATSWKNAAKKLTRYYEEVV